MGMASQKSLGNTSSALPAFPASLRRLSHRWLLPHRNRPPTGPPSDVLEGCPQVPLHMVRGCQDTMLLLKACRAIGPCTTSHRPNNKRESLLCTFLFYSCFLSARLIVRRLLFTALCL